MNRIKPSDRKTCRGRLIDSIQTRFLIVMLLPHSTRGFVLSYSRLSCLPLFLIFLIHEHVPIGYYMQVPILSDRKHLSLRNE